MMAVVICMVAAILCMGLNDVVVSASPGGILVSDKEQSSYIKPFVNMLDHQVMFAEESWGNFKVIDIDKESMTIKVTLNAGHRMNYHSHQHRDEVWTVIAGKGKTIVDGMEQNVKKDLSVQVHPTDEYAQENENGQLGKTEMWYVLDAGRDAKLVYGLKQNCTKAEMRRAIADGTVMKYLQKVPIHKDDLFFIQAGTVHAIGAGALVAEIQENSNLKKSKQRSAKVQKNI